MKAGLVVLSSIQAPTVANVLVSTVAMALGTFVAAPPRRAAKIWGSQRLAKLAPERRASFVRLCRAFGILLCLAGLLLAADSIVF
jgi:hypothetical protein